MAVIAYASANSSPVANPSVDVEVDLSTVALPQTAQIYGGAYDTLNPSNLSWSWSWTIIDTDASTPATLSSNTVQNPTTTVSTWRNALIFLIVTNTNTSESSETDPTLAPDSAFVVARVLSSNAGIQKFAAGERNWTGDVHEWAQAIEDEAAAPIPPHDIIDHADVTTATGAELDVLVSGGYAELPASNALHTHKGIHVDVATPLSFGVVTLEEAADVPASPRVITHERIVLQGRAEVSRVAASGLTLGILPRNYPAGDLIASGGPLCIWKIEETLSIVGLSIILNDGGSASAATAYRFALVRGASQSAVETLTWSTLPGLATPVGSPPSDHAPLVLSATPGTAPTAPAGQYLALLCLAAPKVSEGDQYGSGLSCQVFTRRAV